MGLVANINQGWGWAASVKTPADGLVCLWERVREKVPGAIGPQAAQNVMIVINWNKKIVIGEVFTLPARGAAKKNVKKR